MKKPLHVETYFSRDIVSNNPATKTLVKLNQPIANVRYISLDSIEMTNCLYNIRPGCNELILQHTSTNTTKSYFIPTGNYTEIADICTIINNLLIGNNLVSGLTLNFTTSTDGNFILIQGNASGYKVLPSVFGEQVLGFNSAQIVSGYNVTAALPFNLSHDSYLFLRINNLSIVGNLISSNSIQRGQFKVPLPANWNFLQLQTAQNTLPSNDNIEVDPKLLIHELEFSIYDRYGNLVTTPFPHFSFTLELTIEC